MYSSIAITLEQEPQVLNCNKQLLKAILLKKKKKPVKSLQVCKNIKSLDNEKIMTSVSGLVSTRLRKNRESRNIHDPA